MLFPHFFTTYFTFKIPSLFIILTIIDAIELVFLLLHLFININTHSFIKEPIKINADGNGIFIVSIVCGQDITYRVITKENFAFR